MARATRAELNAGNNLLTALAQLAAPETEIRTVTIANGQTVSDAEDLAGLAVLGIELPAFTGTTLAIHGCSTIGGTYRLITMVGVSNPITVASNGGYSLDPLLTAGWPFIKVVSGTAEVANRDITLLCRPV